MAIESRPGQVGSMSDDHLGAVAVSLVVSELHWTPDVAPAVMDRISRDAVAYPEHFDRRPGTPPPAMLLRRDERSPQRTIGRIAVFAVILAVVVALVVFAATTSGAEATAAADRLITFVTEVA